MGTIFIPQPPRRSRKRTNPSIMAAASPMPGGNRPQPLTVDFSAKSMIRGHSVVSPTAKNGWSGKPIEIGPGGRDHWDGDRLESLIKEKLMMRTKSGNGQVWEAFRLFNQDDDTISPDEFKDKVGHLLNTKLTQEEIMGLFKKYDTDGSGEITIHEFVAGIFPYDFPIRSEDNLEPSPDRELPASFGEAPPCRGYAGHIPGNRDVFGQSGKTSPPPSPCSSPKLGATSPWGSTNDPLSPSRTQSSMGAYPCHVIDPDPAPLLSPKWAKKSP